MIKKLNESVDNRSFEQVARMCSLFGYVLDEESCIENQNGNRYLNVYIYSDGSNKYTPAINSPVRASERRNLVCPKFTMQTASFGSLTYDEYKEFHKAIDRAYELLGYLTNYDFSDFPEVVIED